MVGGLRGGGKEECGAKRWEVKGVRDNPVLYAYTIGCGMSIYF
jgi:hypothetical protein